MQSLASNVSVAIAIAAASCVIALVNNENKARRGLLVANG